MNLILTRYSYAPTFTQGRLLVGGALELHTLENPWRNNAPFASCIPEGDYEMEPFDSTAHPKCWRIFGDTVGRDIDALIPDGDIVRFGILVHVGNKPTDTSGCVLIGTNSDPARVWDSAEALRQVNLVLGNQRHLLRILQYRPAGEYIAADPADQAPDLKVVDDTIPEDEPTE